MRSFACSMPACRVVFGPGTRAQLAREVDALGASRALLLCTPGRGEQAEAAVAQLGTRAVGVFDRAAMHVPVDVAREARALAQQLGADCLVALGGGSTTGLAKAIALDSGLPIVAVPTTFAGSEMTPIYGLTEGGLKTTGRNPRVLPRTVIYDPELVLDLPVPLCVTSGLNAMAHAAEGLYARDGHPVSDLMAEEGLRALAQALPAIRARPSDLAARTEALYGAWLSGMVLGQVGMALHHKLCHVLGGSFGLPHAEVHTVVLPHALAFNAAAAPQAMSRIERALGVEGRASAAAAVFDLAQAHGAPTALRDIGLQASDLHRAAELAVAQPYWNPREVGPAQRDDLLRLLEDAWAGRRPA